MSCCALWPLVRSSWSIKGTASTTTNCYAICKNPQGITVSPRYQIKSTKRDKLCTLTLVKLYWDHKTLNSAALFLRRIAWFSYRLSQQANSKSRKSLRMMWLGFSNWSSLDIKTLSMARASSSKLLSYWRKVVKMMGSRCHLNTGSKNDLKLKSWKAGRSSQKGLRKRDSWSSLGLGSNVRLKRKIVIWWKRRLKKWVLGTCWSRSKLKKSCLS
jgi:hypothetical protein